MMLVGWTLSLDGQAVPVEPVTSASGLGRTRLGKLRKPPVLVESVSQAVSQTRHPASTKPTRFAPILVPRPLARTGPLARNPARRAIVVALCEADLRPGRLRNSRRRGVGRMAPERYRFGLNRIAFQF